MDVLAQAGVRLGVSYPHRIVSDLPAARRVTVRALLARRAAALDFNDPNFDPDEMTAGVVLEASEQ